MLPLLSNLTTYLKSLLPRFKKSDIIVDTSFSFETLEEIVVPMYALYPMPTIISKLNDLTNHVWKTKIKTYKNSSYTTIATIANSITKNQEAIMAMIEKEFADESVTATYDYYKLNLLKYLEGITFFNEYASRWLSACMYETIQTNLILDIKNPTFKENQDYCSNMDNIIAFATIANVLNMPMYLFLASIENLKGHIINPAEWGNISYSPAGAKLDPHKLNFTPLVIGIGAVILARIGYYHGMLQVNAWRVRKYDRNKAELARLQLMVAALTEKLTVTADPDRLANLEKQINYHSNNINILSAKIEAMETEVAA